MEVILFITTLATLVIFLTILVYLIKEIRTESLNRKEIPLTILALSYLVFTISLLLWSINFFTFNIADFLIVFSIVLIVQTVCLLIIQYEIKQNKKIFYALLPLALLTPLIIYIPNSIHLAIPTALFITLLTFLATTSLHEKVTRYLILYTTVSLFLYLFAVLWQNLITTLTLISSILFLAFIISFLKSLQFNTQQHPIISKEPESLLIHFLKHFVFIIIITNFVFIGTISVHEFGHLLASSQSECEESKIVYELEGLPHTQIKCEDTSQQNIWIIGGILLPFIIALFLFFSGGKFIKEFSAQIVGFNLILSYLDIIALGFSKAIATFSLVAGIALTTFSLALLVKTRVDN